ncbi:hypothetical protein ACSVIJ_04310 [Pseudomonas sp. NCHU5208]|uniref:hypothetical protein n=1 Tax=unclassified Pseudomonas TaxID=196821 RepID=UPI003F94AF4F
MISISSSLTTQLVADHGFSFESHFRRGVESIVARQEAPQLHFPESMPLESVRDLIDSLNVRLDGAFPGKGYYAFSPEAEMANPGRHVLVLYSDGVFCNDFMGSVENEILSPIFGGLLQWRVDG